MSIFTGTSVQGLGTAAGGASKSNSVLGKDDFLKLLTTQLSYQDPLNPMDGTEFSAQLAQFSSVEQLSNINNSLEQSLDANYMLTTSINNTLAANVIGRDVKAYGDQVYLGESGEADLNFELTGDARNVEIEILDENDQVRRRISLEDLQSGAQTINWDGKDSSGNSLSKGTYRFRINATDSEGNAVSSQSFIYGSITGVRYSGNGAVLMLGDLAVQMSDVYEIVNN